MIWSMLLAGVLGGLAVALVCIPVALWAADKFLGHHVVEELRRHEKLIRSGSASQAPLQSVSKAASPPWKATEAAASPLPGQATHSGWRYPPSPDERPRWTEPKSGLAPSTDPRLPDDRESWSGYYPNL